MNKVELLAPAGSPESFKGAIHAGADAVYIGGTKYGARAYAGNFSSEEICLAIRYAHLYGRKLYLTVNTLVRESEIEELPGFLRPFYEEGLDGVIVQDLGVFSLLRACFPALALHASTQMNVTGAGGAEFLLAHGASRVVPAREVSLQELRRIKETGIEVEVFIHGAMCYCYSGQCLFSSMLGGRSGNRGRCAQSCRLPYQVLDESGKKKWPGDEYPPCPLSLKDMCTLPFLPELLQAGVDSLKIEGRMKKPEYAAGVTALYRKYLDRYYDNPAGGFEVALEDRERLRRLYIRSEIQEGYYHRHNGREMITPQKPGYLGADEVYLREIRKAFMERVPQIRVDGEICLKKGEPVSCRLWKHVPDGAGRLSVCREGQVAEPAQKQPLTEEAVKKQMSKTGNTPFIVGNLTVNMEPDCFLPVRALNDLRRDVLEELEQMLTENGRRHITERMLLNEPSPETETEATETPYVAVQFETWEQGEALYDSSFPDRLYCNADLLLQKGAETPAAMLRAWKQKKAGRELFLVMPYVIRLRDEAYLSALKKILFCAHTIWDGVLFRNLESLRFLDQNGYQKKKIADANLYVWNREAKRFWRRLGVCVTAPLECNRDDLRTLGLTGMELIVYGRSLLMVTANCLYQTGAQCRRERGEDMTAAKKDLLLLRDRYQADFPVRAVCTHCYNEIYNSVPLSLHAYGRAVAERKPSGIRLAFTTEGPDEIRQVLDCFHDFVTAPERRRQAAFPCTKGHYKRGAE